MEDMGTKTCSEYLIEAYMEAPNDHFANLIMDIMIQVTKLETAKTAERINRFDEATSAVAKARASATDLEISKIYDSPSSANEEYVDASLIDETPPLPEDILQEIDKAQENWSLSTGNGLLERAEGIFAHCQQHKTKSPPWVWAVRTISGKTSHDDLKTALPGILRHLKKFAGQEGAQQAEIEEVEAFAALRIQALQ